MTWIAATGPGDGVTHSLPQLVVGVALLACTAAVAGLLARCVCGPVGARSERRARREPMVRRLTHRWHAPAELPRRRPIQLVAADLRRLSRELAMVPAGTPLVRWKALWAAWDAVLTEAAELLDVPHELPGLPPGTTRDIERIRILAALESAGLVVHD